MTVLADVCNTLHSTRFTRSGFKFVTTADDRIPDEFNLKKERAFQVAPISRLQVAIRYLGQIFDYYIGLLIVFASLLEPLTICEAGGELR